MGHVQDVCSGIATSTTIQQSVTDMKRQHCATFEQLRAASRYDRDEVIFRSEGVSTALRTYESDVVITYAKVVLSVSTCLRRCP